MYTMCCVQNTFINFNFCKSIAKLSNVFHGYPFVVPTCTCMYMATLTNVVGKVGPNYVMFEVAWGSQHVGQMMFPMSVQITLPFSI